MKVIANLTSKEKTKFVLVHIIEDGNNVYAGTSGEDIRMEQHEIKSDWFLVMDEISEKLWRQMKSGERKFNMTYQQFDKFYNLVKKN